MKQEAPVQWSNAFAKLLATKVGNAVERDLKHSFIVSEKHSESLTRFSRSELSFGNLLGSGGFSQAYEIDSISLAAENDCKYEESQKESRKAMMEATSKKNKGRSPYVVKHIKPKFYENPNKFKDAAISVVLEAHFLASLRHPNILSIRGWADGGSSAYATGIHDSFFIVLDRLEGTLDDRIKEWKMQLTRYKVCFLKKLNGDMQELLFGGRFRVAREIASALTYLHDRGVIHRDLKPANVGFDADGTVKLFDFGLAREIPSSGSLDDCYEMTGKVGTRRYMCPEVCRSEPYNQKADVYSFGLILWEMLALEKPFKTLSKSMHRNLVIEYEERPPVHPSWPAGIRQLIGFSWAHEPAVRPSMRGVRRILDNEIKLLSKGDAVPSREKPAREGHLHKTDSCRSLETTDSTVTATTH